MSITRRGWGPQNQPRKGTQAPDVCIVQGTYRVGWGVHQGHSTRTLAQAGSGQALPVGAQAEVKGRSELDQEGLRLHLPR